MSGWHVDPAVGVDRKKQGEVIPELARASVSNAIGVKGNCRFVDVKARRVCGYPVNVKREEKDNAQ